MLLLTAVNFYVFFVRDDTSLSRLLEFSAAGGVAKSSMTGASPGKDQDEGAAAKRKLGAPAEAGTTVARNGLGSTQDTLLSTKGMASPPARSAPPPSDRVVTGEVGRDGTLGEIIEGAAVGAASSEILRAISRLVDPKSLRPGDRYTFTYDPQDRPVAFEYQPSPIVRYLVRPGAEGKWEGEKLTKPLVRRLESASGSIASSLYESVQAAGESPALVSQLAEIFAWDINFYVDTHPKDRWRVVVEKNYLDGAFYSYGNLVAAEYAGRVGTFRAFAWAGADGREPVKFYDEKGRAVAKSFLKTPLRFVRISSKFDLKRLHPILHRTKAHLGVDYAAPTGTPVWASASGRVVECARKPGSGNTVVIQHGNGLATRYYHLSRFAPGMKVGRTVRQKEVIGYVGTTGLSTGPHLHFALTKDGRFVDPTKLQAQPEPPVRNRPAFLAEIKPVLHALETGKTDLLATK